MLGVSRRCGLRSLTKCNHNATKSDKPSAAGIPRPSRSSYPVPYLSSSLLMRRPATYRPVSPISAR
jgi:hypothetical protein